MKRNIKEMLGSIKEKAKKKMKAIEEENRRDRVEGHPHTKECTRSQDIAVLRVIDSGTVDTGFHMTMATVLYRETECTECHTKRIYNPGYLRR